MLKPHRSSEMSAPSKLKRSHRSKRNPYSVRANSAMQPQDLFVIGHVQTSCNRFASCDATPLYRRCRRGGKSVGFERNGCRTCAVKLSVPARRIQPGAQLQRADSRNCPLFLREKVECGACTILPHHKLPMQRISQCVKQSQSVNIVTDQNQRCTAGCCIGAMYASSERKRHVFKRGNRRHFFSEHL